VRARSKRDRAGAASSDIGETPDASAITPGRTAPAAIAATTPMRPTVILQADRRLLAPRPRESVGHGGMDDVMGTRFRRIPAIVSADNR